MIGNALQGMVISDTPQLWACYLSKLKRARAKRLCPSNCNCYILAMQLMEEQAREYSSLLRLNLGICALPTDTCYCQFRGTC